MNQDERPRPPLFEPVHRPLASWVIVAAIVLVGAAILYLLVGGKV